MRDAQLVLTGDLQMIHFQQIMVLQQTSRNGIFNGHDAYQHRVFFSLGKDIPKRITRDNLQFLTFEIITCRNLMIGSRPSLNSYSFHSTILFKKKSHRVIDRTLFI